MAKAKVTSGKSTTNAKKATSVKVARNATTGRFVAAKTGRVVKMSPAAPKLGAGRIQSVVETVVRNQKSR